MYIARIISCIIDAYRYRIDFAYARTDARARMHRALALNACRVDRRRRVMTALRVRIINISARKIIDH